MLDEIYWTKYHLVNELVIYTICAKNIKNLPGKMNELTYIFLEGVPVIYVGITKSDMKERCKKHFKGTAQVSTLRKSLGVLLGYRKQYENGKKEYRFVDEDEEKLSKWMGENLIFYSTFAHTKRQ